MEEDAHYSMEIRSNGECTIAMTIEGDGAIGSGRIPGKITSYSNNAVDDNVLHSDIDFLVESYP